MSYTALYRKFRPSEFEDVRGQENIVTTLKNQVRSGRIGHAYLFCGTRGTGKTTVAKILAKAVNCESPVDGSPCEKCASCLAIQKGISTNVIEIDAASNNSVDNVREIREEVAYRPTEGKYKVYIIDEVHMLSTGAFNALLKTLEEPPEYVIFILATTEAAKIPVTILSRCQRYDFRRMNIDTISGRIKELLDKENIEADEKGIRYLARMADGSMRDALSLLDQCISCYMGERLTYDKILDVLGTADFEKFSDMLGYVIKSDVSGCIRCLDEFVREGKEMAHFASDFTWYMRNLLLIKNAEDLEDILDMSTENIERLKAVGEDLDDEILMRYIRIFSDLTSKLRNITQKRIYVELALIKLCRPQTETDNASILQRLEQVEEKLENGDFTVKEQTVRDNTVEADKTVKAQDEEPQVIEKAAPAELVEICRNWSRLKGNISNNLLRYYLPDDPRYDSRTGECKLYLVVRDPQAKFYFNENLNDAKEETVQAIQETFGKSVDLEIKVDASRYGSLAKVPITEKIKEVINMPIEIE